MKETEDRRPEPEELFDKGKELLRSMSLEQLTRYQSKIQHDLDLEHGRCSSQEQKAYTPMPWMIPSMERAIRVITELIQEKQ